MAELIFKLISLVRDFSQKNTISIYELLRQSGYSKAAKQVSEQELYKALEGSPSFVNDWLQYSEDKRTNCGWYFKKGDEDKYLVGYVDDISVTETEHNDKIKACAKFIKQELDFIISS